MLSTPLVDVMSVRVPEAVVLREELHAAAAVVESSDFLQAPMTAIMPTIMVSQKNYLFHNNLLGFEKAVRLFLTFNTRKGVCLTRSFCP